MSTFSLFFLFVALINISNCQTSYPFARWMEDWSSSNAQTLLNGKRMNESTLFDLVLPGAHRAGMSFKSTDSSPLTSPSNQDEYKNTLNSLNSIDDKKAWSSRQKGSVYNLLMSGARFLEFQFQHEATTNSYHSYNGLLGRNITEVITHFHMYIFIWTNIKTHRLSMTLAHF